jgi:ubiquitin carboxyl-terminal hydrolase 4/11/15
MYDLYAISNHSGGLGGGHYTAYVKNFKNNQWFKMNDSRTSRAADDLCSG